MKKFSFIFLFILLLILPGCARNHTVRPEISASPTSSEEVKTDDIDDTSEEDTSYTDKKINIRVSGKGRDIFKPAHGSGKDYRYGSSIIIDDDNMIHIWQSAPGTSGRAHDCISYCRSEDNGLSFSKETLALCATPNSKDDLSVCDPDVFFYDGYYYLGYTSTINNTLDGICNNVFLARSKDPEGPYKKWDGAGWSDYPEPILYYDGLSAGWGIGEPSFVVLDDTLYLFATVDGYTADYLRLRTTQLWTVSLSDKNWPAHFESKGCALNRTDTPTDNDSVSENDPEKYIFSDCDSLDVVYYEPGHRFLALATNRRFKSNSCLVCFESEDGLNFSRITELNTNVFCGCHNCGLGGDAQGHLRRDTPRFLSYAYSGNVSTRWGIWANRIVPFVISLKDEADDSDDSAENLKCKLERSRSRQIPSVLSVDASDKEASKDYTGKRIIPGKESYNVSLRGLYAVAIRPVFVSGGGRLYELTDDALKNRGICFDVQDDSVCEVRDDFAVIPKRTGSTFVKVYDPYGHSYTVSVNVVP